MRLENWVATGKSWPHISSRVLKEGIWELEVTGMQGKGVHTYACGGGGRKREKSWFVCV